MECITRQNNDFVPPVFTRARKSGFQSNCLKPEKFDSKFDENRIIKQNALMASGNVEI